MASSTNINFIMGKRNGIKHADFQVYIKSSLCYNTNISESIFNIKLDKNESFKKVKVITSIGKKNA